MGATVNLKTIDYSQSTSTSVISKYELLIKKLDFSYFGLISMTILIGSIVGGITASVILNYNGSIWQLVLCAAVSMASNTAGIGQAPTKWVVNLFATNILMNICLILVNVF